ncbi:MAG: ABC transporter substrate-binding protein [Pseudomonadota bacterium]
MLSRRTLIVAVAAAAFAVLGGAAKADARQDAARAFIEKLADTAMTTVAVKDIDDAERNRRFRTLFVESFDLAEIGKLVLGRYWRIATPAQQQEFLKLFEEIQVLTWAKRFKDYSGETLDVVAVHPDGELNVSVDSLIRRQKMDPIAVTWLVRKSGEGFRVLDIKVEGASMAFTHRSEYTSVIQASGGQVEGLLGAMRRKIGQMQAEQSAAR